MNQNKDATIPLNLLPDDITTVMQIAEEDRRLRSQVLRSILEDILSGAIPVDFKKKPTVDRTRVPVKVEPAFRDAFVAFKESMGLSFDQLFEQALKVIRAQRAADTHPKSLDDRLNHLKEKHRHSNSPIPDELRNVHIKDENLPNVA